MNLLGFGLNPMAASRSASLRFCCSCCRALLATSSCSSSSSLRSESEHANRHKRGEKTQMQATAVRFYASTCIKTHLHWRLLPSWGRAAPAGWHRCSLTSAPNAMKVLTLVPVSVAPLPCEEAGNNKKRETHRENGKKMWRADKSPAPQPSCHQPIDLLHCCWTSRPCSCHMCISHC